MPGNLPGLLLTLGIALVTGLICKAVNLPAPYLLGSLSGVWLAGIAVKPLRQRLTIPRWLVTGVILGLGVVIGAIFTADVFANAARWSLTAAAVAVTTVVATGAGFVHLTRRGYDKTLALFCCLPGGQAEVVAMSRELPAASGRAHVVAICHLARITIVFCATPLLLALVYGQNIVDTANAAFENTPRVFDLAIETHLQFIAIAAAGFAGAKILRLPIPHLLGPMLLSAAAHFFALVSIPRIAEFMLLAQIVIGGSVGARLARVPASELAECVRDALVNAVLIITIYGACALALFSFTGNELPNTLLAFIPGGLYEVTVLTLLFGFDIAFVAFHHLFRVLLIYLTLPFIIALIARSPSPPPPHEKPRE